jgi:hypothetical protein
MEILKFTFIVLAFICQICIADDNDFVQLKHQVQKLENQGKQQGSAIENLLEHIMLRYLLT